MADVLSQAQIDALLQAAFNPEPEPAGGGEAQKEEKKYVKYNFRTPRKYTKERLKMLNGVFDNYSRVLNTRINGLLHATCEVAVDTVDEQRYYEFSNALLEGQVVSLAYLNLDGEREETPVIICATTNVMVSMFDRMLGGAGDVDETLPADYSYTNADLALYQYLIADFVSIMAGSWENYVRLDFQFGRVEGNPTLVQLIGMEETVVLVSVNIKFPNVEGSLDICMPDAVLTKIFEAVARQSNVLRRQLDDRSDDIYHQLKDSELEIRAELGRGTVQLRDLYSLNEGDVINMNIKKDSAVALWIGGRQWFSGLMGSHERHTAVKIQEVYHIAEPLETAEEEVEGGSGQEDGQ